MGVITWIFVSLILTNAAVVEADECHRICTEVQKGVNFKSACAPYRNSLPKPKVERFCQMGYTAAVGDNCYNTCINDGVIKPYLFEQAMDDFCRRSLKETPRPLCHDACLGGYRAGVEVMALDLAKKITQMGPNVKSRLEDERDSTVANKPATLETSAEIPPMEDPEKAATTVDLKTEGVTPVAVKYERHNEEDKAESTTMVLSDDGWPTDSEDTKVAGDTHVQLSSEEKAGDEIGHEDTQIDQADIIFSLPVTIDDEEKDLKYFRGDSPVDVVVEFCEEFMANEMDECMHELVDVVEDHVKKHLE